jgi:hypothetical protein
MGSEKIVTRSTPTTTIAAIEIGNSRFGFLPLEVTPPARAARATFFADDDLPIGARQ